MGVLDQERVEKIKRILKWHPRGMTISDLASEMNMNRNLVAKYLDMLLISGQVEMQVIGAAKAYFLSRRVPISAMLEFSSDLVIIIDSSDRILQVNEQVPMLLAEPRESLIGKRLDEIAHPFIHGLYQDGQRPGHPFNDEPFNEVNCMIRGQSLHFRTKKIPTAFEDGSSGFTFIIEDVTARKKVEEMLRLSEARYRGLVQSSGEAIIGNATDGAITSWNPAAERLFGYSEAEVLGRPIQMLVAEGAEGVLALVLEGVGKGECFRRQDIRMVRKDGFVVDLLISVSPIFGESGAVVGISSIARDITGEKMEQSLRDHEDQYRTLVEDLNVGIYRSTGDPQGKFVWGNTALLNILGYHSISDLQGVSVIDMFSSPEGRTTLLNELQKNRFVKNRILHLKRADDTPISVSVTALAEFDDRNNLVFINGVVQDITGISSQLASQSGIS